jgi:glycosyltransferase involved in cell wall biosynthesis
MSAQKVLLISQVFYPDEVAVANLCTNLFSELANSGIEIDVWCAQPTYTCLEKQPRLRTYNGMNIKYLKSTQFHKDILIGRLLNYISFTVSVVFNLIFSKSKTPVISHTSPPFLAILLSYICKAKKRDFNYVIMDVFPDGLIRLKRFSKNNLLIKIWGNLHLSALKHCTKIVVIGRDMGEWLRTTYPAIGDKMMYIPLWQDEEMIHPLSFDKNIFISENNLKDQFVVQYSGNMGLWNEMDSIGRAVNEKHDGLMFLFFGGGMRKKELLDSINEINPENARFFPFQSNENYSTTVSACHVALVSLREEAEGMAVPSKIIGIMAAGIPVIAMVPENSEIAYIVKEENCGIVINSSDNTGLISAIIKLKNDVTSRNKMGQNGRAAFLHKYTTKIIAEKYKMLLENKSISR